MTLEFPLRINPLHERWQVIAGGRSRFPIYLDNRENQPPLQGIIGGVPASWVTTLYHPGVIWVDISVPYQTAPGKYPLSVTLCLANEPRKRTTIPLTLEIRPAVAPPFRLPSFPFSPRWMALAAVGLVFLWLGVSFWWGSQSAGSGAARASTPAIEEVVVPSLAQAPVVIGAEWQAGLATPTLAPTPTLRPTPTPLPPLPTPQPPPPPARSAEGMVVDGAYTYERMFQEVGAQFGVDWRLLASIAQRESQLRSDAVGGSGEQGMMQMMPQTWGEFAPLVGESDPFNAYSSTRVAAYYLVYLREYLYSQGYTESYWLLVAYNWGPNNLRSHLASGGDWGSIPTLRQNYAYTIVNRVNDPNDTLWTEMVHQEVPR